MSPQPANPLRIARPATPPPIPKDAAASTPEKTPPPGKKHRQPGGRAREGMFRGIILLLLVLSIAAALWSFLMVLSPRQQESARLSRELSSISTRVDELDRAWSSEAALQVSNKFEQASSQLITSSQGLAAWISDIDSQAAPLELGLDYTFSEASTQNTNLSLAIIPTTVTAEIASTGSTGPMNSRYHRLLQLIEKVTLTGKRTDIAELKVTGGTNSSDRAVLILNLWAKEDQ